MRTIPLLLLSALALTACKPDKVATPLLLGDGKAVDPICFVPYLMGENTQKTIQLGPDCAPGYTSDNTDYAPIDGYNGTGFYVKDDPDTRGGMRPAFISYRVVGDVADGTVIDIMGSGGGTGIVSAIVTAKREGDTLTVLKSHAGGDRCNGGITDASVKNGKLHYGLNITPYDLLTVGTDQEPKGIKAYDDLDACAACCMGEALYEDDQFVGVRLPDEFVVPERPAEQTVQICFDKIMAGQDKLELNAQEVAVLRDKIVADCTP